MPVHGVTVVPDLEHQQQADRIPAHGGGAGQSLAVPGCHQAGWFIAVPNTGVGAGPLH